MSKRKYQQSRKSSLLEAHINSLIGAPLAIMAHAALLIVAGYSPSWENATIFATMSWPVFFYLSVGRIYLFRRIFEKYNLALEPLVIYRKFKSQLAFKKAGKMALHNQQNLKKKKKKKRTMNN